MKGAPLSFFTWFAFERLGQEKNVLPDSDDLAVSLADEIYPHAHTIFQESFVEDADEFDDDEDLESDGNLSFTLWLIVQVMRRNPMTKRNKQRSLQRNGTRPINYSRYLSVVFYIITTINNNMNKIIMSAMMQ